MWLGQIVQGVAGHLNTKASLRHQGLQAQKKLKNFPSTNQERLLFHCASFGEFEQIKPLLEKVKENHKDVLIYLSFFSPSGYEMAKDYEHADQIVYLPIDTKSNMNLFIDLVRPSKVFLVKYELWLNFISILHKRKIPLYLISAQFRPGQFMFSKFGGLFRKGLRQINSIFVSDESSKKLLQDIGISSVVSGDTRADRVLERKMHENNLISGLGLWVKDRKVLVLGSIWPEDWAIFQPVIGEILKQYKVIIAPHEISQSFIDRIILGIGSNVLRWTDWSEEEAKASDVLVLNTVGLLADVYQYGSIAYVGGAFKQGLHNIFEPAVYKMPILFGPETTKFIEAQELMNAEAAFSVKSSNELLTVLTRLLDENIRQKAGDKAQAYVRSAKGSTEVIYSELIETKD